MSRRRRAQAAPANAREVLGYFLRNPQAADTLEGVVRWRLIEERIYGSVAETDRAVAWLVEEGFLLKEFPPGSDTIFRLNHDRVREAQKLTRGAR